MRSSILTAACILVLGTVAGLTANVSRYHLPWIRPTEAPPPPVDEIVLTSQPVQVATSQAAPRSNPCAPQPGDKPWTVRMECVLSALENPGSAFIVDAREDHDFNEGHLRGSIHLPSSGIYANIQNLMGTGAQPGDVIIVYCGGGDCEASHNVAEALRNDFRYERVYVYEKGWQEVTSSGKFSGFIEAGEGSGE